MHLQPTQLLELALGDLECERENYKQKQKYRKVFDNKGNYFTKKNNKKRERSKRSKKICIKKVRIHIGSHDEETVRSRWKQRQIRQDRNRSLRFEKFG